MTWRRRCRDRWSDREKERSHSVQRKGLIPVCLRKCRVSSSERAKRQVQPSQVQWYGFSPGHRKTGVRPRPRGDLWVLDGGGPGALPPNLQKHQRRPNSGAKSVRFYPVGMTNNRIGHQRAPSARVTPPKKIPRQKLDENKQNAAKLRIRPTEGKFGVSDKLVRGWSSESDWFRNLKALLERHWLM